MILLPIIILCGLSPVIPVRIKKNVPCHSDDDCQRGLQYCYKHGFCANCTECSVYHRSPGEQPCVKQPSKCGPCLPGYAPEILSENRVKDPCSLITPPDDQTFRGGESTGGGYFYCYLAGGGVLGLLAVILCVLYLCFKKKISAHPRYQNVVKWFVRNHNISSSRQNSGDAPTKSIPNAQDVRSGSQPLLPTQSEPEDVYSGKKPLLTTQSEPEDDCCEKTLSPEQEIQGIIICKENDHYVQSVGIMPGDPQHIGEAAYHFDQQHTGEAAYHFDQQHTGEAPYRHPYGQPHPVVCRLPDDQSYTGAAVNQHFNDQLHAEAPQHSVRSRFGSSSASESFYTASSGNYPSAPFEGRRFSREEPPSYQSCSLWGGSNEGNYPIINNHVTVQLNTNNSNLCNNQSSNRN